VPLDDDADLLRRPIGFAVRVTNADPVDDDDLRRRLPGLLKAARTFYGNVLEREFGVALGGFPLPARREAVKLEASLRDQGEGADAARRMLFNLIDLCDLETTWSETSGEDDDDAEAEYHDAILDLITQLLGRFADWAATTARLPKLTTEARRGYELFRAAANRLSS
jgi:hypothetical protein